MESDENDYFACSVLIDGVKYHAGKPNMIGKTFLRLERDFDKHVAYCRDEPSAQDFLVEHEEVQKYFAVSFELFSENQKNPLMPFGNATYTESFLLKRRTLKCENSRRNFVSSRICARIRRNDFSIFLKHRLF